MRIFEDILDDIDIQSEDDDVISRISKNEYQSTDNYKYGCYITVYYYFLPETVDRNNNPLPEMNVKSEYNRILKLINELKQKLNVYLDSYLMQFSEDKFEMDLEKEYKKMKSSGKTKTAGTMTFKIYFNLDRNLVHLLRLFCSLYEFHLNTFYLRDDINNNKKEINCYIIQWFFKDFEQQRISDMDTRLSNIANFILDNFENDLNVGDSNKKEYVIQNIRKIIKCL